MLNRMAGKPIAIVEDFPGTTRDRLFADASWNGVDFTIVDTGGIESRDESTVDREVRKQAESAISEADVIIFLTDAKEGLMPADQDVADLVRRSGKPVLLAANKVDNVKLEPATAEFINSVSVIPYLSVLIMDAVWRIFWIKSSHYCRHQN